MAVGLVGSIGCIYSANFGDDYALFEPAHGSAPKYKGANKVNPAAMILSAVMMLRHINQNEKASKLESAVASVIAKGKFVTYDLKENRDDPTAVGTKERADAIIDEIKRK